MTPLGIGIFVGCCFLIDITATFIYIRHIRRRYPRMDYYEFELNRIVGWAWRKFGFERGTLLTPILLSPFFMMVYISILADERMFFFFFGFYLLLFILHWWNLAYMLTKTPTNFSRMYDEIYGKPDNRGIAYALYKGGKENGKEN